MSTESPNLGLTLPEGTDTVTRLDYRGNLEKIDAAVDKSAEQDVYITRTDGKITKAELKDGSTVKRTVNFARTAGKISTIERVETSRTILATINRTDDVIVSVTKDVS